MIKMSFTTRENYNVWVTYDSSSQHTVVTTNHPYGYLCETSFNSWVDATPTLLMLEVDLNYEQNDLICAMEARIMYEQGVSA